MDILDIKRICEATINIKKCIDDNDYLCEELSRIDRTLIKEYFKCEKDGPIINLRKEVCKHIILYDKINSSELITIIDNIKSNNIKAFKSYNSNYSIFNSLINLNYKYCDDIVYKLKDIIQEKIGDVSSHVWTLNGSRNQGQANYSIAFYNNEFKHPRQGLQLFIDFMNGEIKYGLYKNESDEYPIGPFFTTFENFENFYKFLEENKSSITDVENKNMTFLEAAKFILNKNKNEPMTSNHIWKLIEKENLVNTEGMTPNASLNTIILNDCVDSPTSKSQRVKSKNIFKIVGNKPNTYILNHYMSDNIKDALIKNGFITIDMLNEILKDYKLK